VLIEPEIKYEGFGGGPLLVGGLGPGPPGPPLNLALGMNQIFSKTRMFRHSVGEVIITLALFISIQYRNVMDS